MLQLNEKLQLWAEKGKSHKTDKCPLSKLFVAHRLAAYLLWSIYTSNFKLLASPPIPKTGPKFTKTVGNPKSFAMLLYDIDDFLLVCHSGYEITSYDASGTFKYCSLHILSE